MKVAASPCNDNHERERRSGLAVFVLPWDGSNG